MTISEIKIERLQPGKLQIMFERILRKAAPSAVFIMGGGGYCHNTAELFRKYLLLRAGDVTAGFTVHFLTHLCVPLILTSITFEVGFYA